MLQTVGSSWKGILQTIFGCEKEMLKKVPYVMDVNACCKEAWVLRNTCSKQSVIPVNACLEESTSLRKTCCKRSVIHVHCTGMRWRIFGSEKRMFWTICDSCKCRVELIFVSEKDIMPKICDSCEGMRRRILGSEKGMFWTICDSYVLYMHTVFGRTFVFEKRMLWKTCDVDSRCLKISYVLF